MGQRAQAGRQIDENVNGPCVDIVLPACRECNLRLTFASRMPSLSQINFGYTI